jgi:ATP-dependent helicase HrpB
MSGNASVRPWEGLPIAEVVAGVRECLEQGTQLILEAPPGAGKSTTLPLALLDANWCAGKRLLLLEPRRVAARAVATRMASHLGEAPGGRIGWRMRDDTQVSRQTLIEVVTEGVLTRILQDDPELPGIAGILFDEFHERSLQADLGLALALEAQATLRPDLRLVVMSATLEGLALAGLLPDARVLRSAGRSWPVAVEHLNHTPLRLADAPVAATVDNALAAQSGDVLVFLPGAREIETLVTQLRGKLPAAVDVYPLYGELRPEAQELALRPPATGRRRVVVATTIAQTSLTIEGIQAVVDSGYTRRNAYDPDSGMSRLVTTRVSRAAAEQRRGRAGRLAAGYCWRLWTTATHVGLAEQDPPEILAADLMPLALDLAVWGDPSGRQLRWLDPPPADALAQARALLEAIGAVSPAGGVTAHGRELQRLGLHPRLGHMLAVGSRCGAGPKASRLAALLAERDPLRGLREASLEDRLLLLEGREAGAGGSADRGALSRIRRSAERLATRIRSSARETTGATLSTGGLVSLAYPERIAQRRPGSDGAYRLASGRGARLNPGDPLLVHDWLAVASLRDEVREAVITLAAPVDPVEIEALHGERMEEFSDILWSEREAAVTARSERRLGALTLQSRPLRSAPIEALRSAMLTGIASLGIAALPWTEAARRLRERLAFMAHWDGSGDWPAVDDATLLASLPDWLGGHLDGITRQSHLDRLDLCSILMAALTWPQRQQLDVWAPTHLEVPSGSRVPVDYSDPAQPRLDVRLQECFGLLSSPRLADGRIAVLMSLLSPAGRPVQLTRDLQSFWQQGYVEVRKELKGRYPKHYWPDDPLRAEATARTRPRRPLQ